MRGCLVVRRGPKQRQRKRPGKAVAQQVLLRRQRRVPVRPHLPPRQQQQQPQTSGPARPAPAPAPAAVPMRAAALMQATVH